MAKNELLLYSRLTNSAKPSDHRTQTLLVVKTKQFVALTAFIPSLLLWVVFHHKVYKDHKANFDLIPNPLCSSCSLWLTEIVQNY